VEGEEAKGGEEMVRKGKGRRGEETLKRRVCFIHLGRWTPLSAGINSPMQTISNDCMTEAGCIHMFDVFGIYSLFYACVGNDKPNRLMVCRCR
jgi:hypothetical protein